MENKNIITIENYNLQIKEYCGKRVVTLKDIDSLHGRVQGTASRNFNNNRKHFIENVDYYIVNKKNLSINEIRSLDFFISNKGLTLLTESGYLMLVKSLDDKLAWNIQRELINSYFKVEKCNNTEINNNTFTKKELENIAEQLINYGVVLNTLIETAKVKQEEQQKTLDIVKEKLVSYC